MMVDALGHEIHVGDKILRASTWGHQGIQWSVHEVVGFTPQRIKIDEKSWKKDYSIICSDNSIIISEEDYQKWKEKEKCKLN